MDRSNTRHSINLIKLEFAATRLENLLDNFVFVGGCTTGILITDPHAPDIRTTLDVDCIVHVISLSDYHKVEKSLIKLGFKKDINETVICRWYHDDLILDVMPTNENILGFANRWYEYAIKNSHRYEIVPNLFVKVINAPSFIATKLEAFKGRGNGDYLGSHDLEDIIAIIDGRKELLNEIALIDGELKIYLQTSFSELLNDYRFLTALPGHLNYGQLTNDMTRRVVNRMEQIVKL